MKEIKAYLRPTKVDSVVEALTDAGFSAITLIPVHAVGGMADPETLHISARYVRRCSGICKLELVCCAEDVDRALRLIQELGYSGYAGDGMVFVSGIERALKIRTKAEDRDALERIGGTS
jgi:nitrogen regulatory protein P-II 1